MTPGTARIITAMSDVPDAWRMAMPTSDSMSGTMMKPPPTPTYPEANPAIKPMPTPMSSCLRVSLVSPF